MGVLSCGSAPKLKTVASVDLKKFMGPWYVIAHIPIFLEKNAYNGIETYSLDPDGSVATTFTFNEGALDGPLKKYNPRGFVRDKKSNAVWDMQFLWPFKSEFLIVYLNDDYSQTIIGRSKLDYVWIMARTPSIPESDLEDIKKQLAGMGYDISKLRMVPHGKAGAEKPSAPEKKL